MRNVIRTIQPSRIARINVGYRPVGAFSKSRTEIRSVDSRVSARDLPTYLREAERGYRWRSVPVAAVPGFGEPLLVQVSAFPWRK